MKNNKLLLIATMISTSVLISFGAFAQTTSTAKKIDQVPVVDPFARNVNRPTQYGSVPAPRARDEKRVSGGAADSQYQYDEDFARLPDLRNYRVVAISTKPAGSKPIIVGPDLVVSPVGTAPRKIYLRLSGFPVVGTARQYIWDFFEENKKFIDANFVIRKDTSEGKNLFNVDIGPFVSVRHATLYCAQIVSQRGKRPHPCNTSLEFQASAEKSSFKSTASVGLSSSMVQQILNSNKTLDAARLFGASYEISEGDTLGKDDFVVIKISQRGVYLANETGHLFLLPTDILPLPASADEATVSE
jgi:hypothetical protein